MDAVVEEGWNRDGVSQPRQDWSVPVTELCHTSLPSPVSCLAGALQGKQRLFSTDSWGFLSPGSPGSGQAGPAHHQGVCASHPFLLGSSLCAL